MAEARAALVLNRKAGSAESNLQALLEECLKFPELEIWDSHDERLGERVGSVDLLIAAGGDGTIHRLVNANPEALARFRLGIIPLGTGNDLARTLGIPLDPLEALRAAMLEEGEMAIDLIRVIAPDGRVVLGVNHVSGGLGGKIEEEIEPGERKRWKRFAYLKKAAAALADPSGYGLRLKLDDQWLEAGRALSLVIGNGRTAGGGFRVAPNADPSDRYLDVVIAREGGLGEMLEASARLLAGDYTHASSVDQYRARHVRAETEMSFSVDGELFSKGTTEFRVLPGALRLAYSPERLRRAAA